MTPITLRGGGLCARVLPLGATVQDLRMDGVAHSLVLGHEDPEEYRRKGRYTGAIIGRFANRIGQGRFRLDGRDYQTDRNWRGHTLHGGADGADAHIWQTDAMRADAVTLSLALPDGHMGFPGRIAMTVQISLADGALQIGLTAQSDAPTPCSLTHHGYFNLDGTADARSHRLQIDAEHYLPVDGDLIPTGQVAPVAGTVHDFRTMRPVGSGHDVNLCPPGKGLRDVARLSSGGLMMTVATTAPGLQLYDGAHLDYAGLALEAQEWPDAPNNPHFPDAILRPGQVWRQETHYRFAKEAA